MKSKQIMLSIPMPPLSVENAVELVDFLYTLATQVDQCCRQKLPEPYHEQITDRHYQSLDECDEQHFIDDVLPF